MEQVGIYETDEHFTKSINEGHWMEVQHKVEPGAAAWILDKMHTSQ